MNTALLRAAGVGAVCLLSSCSGGTDTAAPAHIVRVTVGSALAAQQVLSRSLDDSPHTMDPQLTTDVPGQRIGDDLFEGLTRVGIDGKASPGVASAWESSADGRTWTFHLRPDARWSNGAPITSQDFVYSLRREVDPKTGSQYAQGLAALNHALEITEGKLPPSALGVEAIDAHTLKLTLTGPTPYLLDLMTQNYAYPVYRPVVEQYGDDWSRPEHIVSNGAFVLRENVLGNRITLEKNVNYWDAAHVHLQRVIYYELTDRAVEANRFMAGDIDWSDSFAANQTLWLKSQLGAQVVTSPYYGTYLLGFNAILPPFKDNRALRQALVLALDLKPLVREMKQGLYEPAYTLMPPLPGYTQPVPAWTRLSDDERRAQARALYRQAGYSAAHPLRIDLNTAIGGPDDRHLFEAVAALWHSVLGAEVRVYEREFKVLLQDRTLHKLPLFYNAWIGDYPDPYTFMQIFYTDDGNNNSAYSNPAFDQLIDQAGQEPDNTKRYALFEQAEQILIDDAAFLPLYFYSTRHLVKPYLRGWQSNVMDRNLSQYMYLLEHQEQ